MIKILLDAGHGAGIKHNRGGLLFNEGDENFDFAVKLKTELEKFSNVSVKLTRNKITDDPELYERGQMANGYDLFISTHSNAFSSDVRGSEIFLSVKNKGNDKLASKLLNTATRLINTNNRGIKYKYNNDGATDWYGVLRNSGAKLSMLIEWFFHTNMEDSKNYLKVKNELIKQVAKDIANYYSLSVKNETVTKAESTDNSKLFRVQVGAFKDKENAYKLVNELKEKGFNAIIKEDGEVIIQKETVRQLRVGDYAMVKQGAKSYNGNSIASFVFKQRYKVSEISGDRVVLDENGINTPFNINDLIF